MDAKQIIRELMKKNGIGMEKLAENSGMKGITNVTGILNRGTSLRVDKLDQLISAMGYKIMIVPESVKGRDGWYEADTAGSGTETCIPEKSVEKNTKKAKKAVRHERTETDG